MIFSQLPPGRSRIGRSALSVKVVLQGEERYVFNARTYRLSPGQMMIADVGDEMEVGVASGCEPVGLCLYLPDESPADLSFMGADPVVLPLVDHPLATWFAALGERLANDPAQGAAKAPAALAQARAAVNAFVGDTARRLDVISGDKASTRLELLRRVELARDHLHAVSDRPVSLSELAVVAGLSRFHLARTFRAVHGAPPAAYHRDLRLDLASRLLRERGRQAHQVALQVGFADQASFTRAFARRYGVTPGRLRAVDSSFRA